MSCIRCYNYKDEIQIHGFIAKTGSVCTSETCPHTIPAIMLSFYKRKGPAISLSEDVYDTVQQNYLYQKKVLRHNLPFLRYPFSLCLFFAFISF
jgi:hypothetical protein